MEEEEAGNGEEGAVELENPTHLELGVHNILVGGNSTCLFYLSILVSCPQVVLV